MALLVGDGQIPLQVFIKMQFQIVNKRRRQKLASLSSNSYTVPAACLGNTLYEPGQLLSFRLFAVNHELILTLCLSVGNGSKFQTDSNLKIRRAGLQWGVV